MRTGGGRTALQDVDSGLRSRHPLHVGVQQPGHVVTDSSTRILAQYAYVPTALALRPECRDWS